MSTKWKCEYLHFVLLSQTALVGRLVSLLFLSESLSPVANRLARILKDCSVESIDQSEQILKTNCSDLRKYDSPSL